jgi:hypothetical protein
VCENGRSRNRIALVKVVGFDPDHEQAVDQSSHGFHVVIDPGQQDGLAAQRDSCIGEAVQARAASAVSSSGWAAWILSHRGW